MTFFQKMKKTKKTRFLSKFYGFFHDHNVISSEWRKYINYHCYVIFMPTIAVDDETLNEITVLKENEGLSSNQKVIKHLIDFYEEVQDRCEKGKVPSIGEKGFWETWFGEDE